MLLFRRIALAVLALIFFAGAASRPALAAGSLTFTTTSPTDWKASNDFVAFDYNPTNGSIKTLSVTFNGVRTLIVDPAKHYAAGNTLQLYHLYGGAGTGGPLSGAFYKFVPGQYVDMWTVKPAVTGNPMGIETHWVLQAGNPGIHFYAVVRHAAADPTGGFGAATFNLKAAADLFQWEYLADTGPRNRGPFLYHFPTDQFQHDAGSPTYLYGAGRQVQAETIDYNGLLNNPNDPLGRQFITKYDYSTYAQYHVAHGMFNDSLGVWMVIPRSETMIAGPTKQTLEGTAPVIQMEYESGHLGGQDYVPPTGVNSTRLFGPFYLRFNAIDAAKKTPDDLFADAKNSVAACQSFYDSEATLQANGYVPIGGRGAVTAAIANPQGWSATPDDNVIVLSDPLADFQQSVVGFQYWDYVTPAVVPTTGVVTLPQVAPGTYRLSAYQLGQWGEGRADNVVVTAGNTTALTNITYTPENFSAAAPVWTIGTPDRSAHEFLHGHNALGQDDREYFGFYNHWLDLAPNNGKVVYYATDVPGHTATNNLDQWPAFHWKSFNPGLYPGLYNASDITTDGYKYIAPAYVGNPTTYNGPAWEVHFTTTAAQQAQGKYAILSMGWAAQQASIIVNLNGHQLIARPPLGSDPMVRSGVAGWYSWSVLQWDATALNAPGVDNVLTIDVSQPRGVLHDALRMEISNTSADPAVRGWHDYEYLYNRTDTPPDTTQPDMPFVATPVPLPVPPSNPAPTITSLNPPSALVGSASFPLTINGTGFSASTIVQFGNDVLTPTAVSATALTVNVPATDVASVGSPTVTVTNPLPGGGTATATFTVVYSAPTITSLSPTSVVAGSPAFTLSINGTGFSAATVVQFGADTLTPNAGSATTLSIPIPAADVAVPGPRLVTVTNPTPGGGTATANFIVTYPAPIITGLSPATALAGSAGFPLTINGAGFNAATTVQFGTDILTPTSISAMALTVSIPAADVASASMPTVTVTNPTPGGGTATAAFTVVNPAPMIIGLSRNSVLAGSSDMALTISGTGFIGATTVQFGSDTLGPTSVTAGTITLVVPAADIAVIGPRTVSVANPAPGGGVATAPFTVSDPANTGANNAPPTITSLSPASAVVGSGGFPLTVSGTGFGPATTVQFGPDALTPTAVSPSSLVVQVPAADVSSAGVATVVIANPTPGGGTATATFTITNVGPTPTNPLPTISTLSPSTATAGAGALTLTIAGANFLPGTAVEWGGTGLATTFVSAEQVTAIVSANLLQSPGPVSVSVVNPGPGGGASNSVTFTVTPATLPTTVAAVAGPQDANGVYTAPVTVTLTAGAGSLPVATTTYTIDGGLGRTYSAPFTVGTDGPHTVRFHSTDTAGGSEAEKTAAFTLRVIIHTFAAGLQMFSVPADYSALSWAQALSTGTPTMAVWVGGAYVLTPASPADALRPGIGYWVRFRQSTNLYGPGVPTPTNSPFSIALRAGWNMIGDPFPKSITLSTVGVQSGGVTYGGLAAARDAKATDGTLYSYPSDAAQYQTTSATGALQPYMGYWLYAYAPCTLLVPPP